MNSNLVENVRAVAKKEYERESGSTDWKYHILVVVKYARFLARKFGADENVAEISAILHDIGRAKFGGENHEITGVPEAEKILKNLNCPQEIIEEAKHCVRTHRGSKDVPPQTLIGKIIANSDALSHFDAIPVLIKVGLRKESNDIEKALVWVNDKLERDFNKKLTLPGTKEMAEGKYNAFKLLYNSMKEYS